MDCERVRDQFLALVPGGGGVQWPEPVVRHLEGCGDCRAELEVIQKIWSLLAQWPEAEPSPGVRTLVARRARWQFLKESVLTVSGWAPAVMAAVIGVGLSLGLSLVIPYSLLIELCRQSLQVSDPHAAPYLLAGMIYGMPLLLGVWVLRRQAVGVVIIGLEASVLFLVILAPYVVAQCREFAPALQVAFISGLVAGAVISSLAGLWLVRLVRFGEVQT